MREARHPRTNAESFVVFRRVPFEAIHIFLRQRSWSNKLHISLYNIPQLGEFIDPGCAEDRTETRHLSVDHCFEFEDGEWFAVKAETGLGEEEGFHERVFIV